uniref:Protein Ycf2-like n=1 Tax=Cucumis melo TaxID=3656 RepID=A0A9I9EA73_CUCME
MRRAREEEDEEAKKEDKGARDFEEHLGKVEKDKEEEEDEEMNLGSTKPTSLGTDDDQDDEGNGSMVGNQNQTFEVTNGGSNKLNTLETTTEQQKKGGDDSLYKKHVDTKDKTNLYNEYRTSHPNKQ